MGAALAACPLCRGDSLAPLPVPVPGAGMRSDGRILERAVDRIACRACGGAFHRVPPDEAEVKGWYAHDYALASAAPAADAQRAAGYAQWLRAAASNAQPLCILDVGAGSGGLLRALGRAAPAATLVGCEPSADRAAPLVEGRMSLHGGNITAIPAGTRADWAISVNVIEHASDPVAFLADMAARLAPDGEILVICPEGARPNLELLFVDHLTSFTPAAFAACALRAGLALVRTEPAPVRLGDFRLYVLRPGNARAAPAPIDGQGLVEERTAYLRAWQALDSRLQERLEGRETAAFGGGQMAALLRAYAPRTWSRVPHLVVDNPDDAWALGKPVRATSDVPDETLLLAVAPSSQATLAEKFESEGRRVVRFDDLIAR